MQYHLHIQYLNHANQLSSNNKKVHMSSQLINIAYPIENILKLAFIPMAILNANYAVLVAFIVSVMALLRVLKTPQFNKQYAQRVLVNNHGQNLMYIGLGAMGYVNFLFYAPLIIFYAFGLVEFVNMKYSNTNLAVKYMPYINLIRNQKFYIMEGRCKVQYVYFIYLIFSLPLDFFNRLLKVVLLGQYLLLKYRISNEARYAASQIHKVIDEKTKIVSVLNSTYNKLANYIYKFATQDPRGQQAQQPQQ